MFSALSEFIVTAVSGVSDFSCRGPLVLRPAQAYSVSAADTAIDTACGRVAVAYQRTGGVQCGLLPEGRSVSRPGFPSVADRDLECGEEGGHIVSIDFASWGQPSAYCLSACFLLLIFVFTRSLVPVSHLNGSRARATNATTGGTCGSYAANASCHADVRDILSARCVGQTRCTLSSRADDWPAVACTGPRRLVVQVPAPTP